jgi:ketosteroid isomerase-like protein
MDSLIARKTSPDDEIELARHAFIGAFARRDSDGAAAVYTQDARLLAPSTELLRGRDAVRDFWRAGIESGIESVELEMLELQPYSGLAYEIGRYVLRLSNESGTTVVDRGKYLLVHRREADGAWRRAVEMFDSDHSERASETGGAR